MKLPAASCGVSKRNCAVAKPAFALTSYGAVHLALHPCSKLQGIRAKAKKLEQLCFLESGISIHVVVTDYRSIGIDRPEDIKTVSKILMQRSGSKPPYPLP